jgi:putative ubiquitin-RnfH superfamily antitoxin RatB of RatAB toxin-antitoxin module
VSDEAIQVSLVYSPGPRQVHHIVVQLAAGSTLLQALQSSGLLRLYPLLDQAGTVLGIWGRKSSLEQTLRERDRIEIYRPLKVDPKVARRQRFTKQGVRSAGLFATRRSGAKAGY